MSKGIFDWYNVGKNATSWLDHNVFGVDYPKKNNRSDMFGDIIDKWNSEDDDKHSLF